MPGVARLAPSFHGITAVAELKLAAPVARVRGVVRFHGITAVAELKRHQLTRSRPDRPGFHGITAVAELKPGDGRGRRLGPVRFPRHHSRGRIEACPR